MDDSHGNDEQRRRERDIGRQHDRGHIRVSRVTAALPIDGSATTLGRIEPYIDGDASRKEIDDAACAEVALSLERYASFREG
jgi:hypothetical protein